eukprot:NODE_10_length_47437_cov_0.363429.p22 type:complete len:177 gc:universal NODE_10_length_47437_cov_0.363429:32463-32993(+)
MLLHFVILFVNSQVTAADESSPLKNRLKVVIPGRDAFYDAELLSLHDETEIIMSSYFDTTQIEDIQTTTKAPTATKAVPKPVKAKPSTFFQGDTIIYAILIVFAMLFTLVLGILYLRAKQKKSKLRRELFADEYKEKEEENAGKDANIGGDSIANREYSPESPVIGTENERFDNDK